MARNFVRRVDVAFPVEEPALKERLLGEILGTMLGDNCKARALKTDGAYQRVQPGTRGTGAASLRSQERFIALARRAALSDASRSAAVEPLLGSPRASRRQKD
jgi:polyphosphate kinase